MPLRPAPTACLGFPRPKAARTALFLSIGEFDLNSNRVRRSFRVGLTGRSLATKRRTAIRCWYGEGNNERRPYSTTSFAGVGNRSQQSWSGFQISQPVIKFMFQIVGGGPRHPHQRVLAVKRTGSRRPFRAEWHYDTGPVCEYHAA